MESFAANSAAVAAALCLSLLQVADAGDLHQPRQVEEEPPAEVEDQSDRSAEGEQARAGERTGEEGRAAVWDFDQAAPGQIPEGWRIAQTNSKQSPATWSVIEAAGAPSGHRILALVRSEHEGQVYNLAIAEETEFADLDLSVKVKAVAGEEDQGGGPIWRCMDERNYYVCRINPLEDNYRVYVVKDGVRKELGSATVVLEEQKWYTVRVVMRGKKITCSLDDRELLNAADETFADPGMIGLWTKADAATGFDDLNVKELK